MADAGSGAGPKRLNESFVEGFIAATDNLESPVIFRRWTAITTIAAALEQRVWVTTSSPLYPNLYAMIIGHPGVGKTRTIRVGRGLYRGLTEPYLAPISLTFASLVDTLRTCKRSVQYPGNANLEYNSMFICADELGNFIHKYDNEMVDGLSAFYDPDPYSQSRRTNDLRIKIAAPQINLLTGSTPQNLTALMPEKAWGQGFTSRLIMVFSDERFLGDDFAESAPRSYDDLAHDLAQIHGLVGKFHITAGYRERVNEWRKLGEPPTPNHPRLLHYVTRRRTHLYKLSMVAAVDHGNALVLTENEFNRAYNWLCEAEATMPDIFKAGATNADAQAMEEIVYYVRINDKGHGMSETAISRFAQKLIPINSVYRILDIMAQSGMLVLKVKDKTTQIRYFSAGKE